MARRRKGGESVATKRKREMAQRYTKCYACGSYTFPMQRPATGSIIPADLPNTTCVRCMLDVMQERGLLKPGSQAPPPPPPPLPKPD